MCHMDYFEFFESRLIWSGGRLKYRQRVCLLEEGSSSSKQKGVQEIEQLKSCGHVGPAASPTGAITADKAKASIFNSAILINMAAGRRPPVGAEMSLL